MDQLERRNRRLTAALALMVVAICAVVTMAATGEKESRSDVVIAKRILVMNDDGNGAVAIGVDGGGNGLITTLGANGKELVMLRAGFTGNGMVKTYGPNGKELVVLSATENGGGVSVNNKTGESIVQLSADEYGNGVVGAYNRKGKGRMLKPGP